MLNNRIALSIFSVLQMFCLLLIQTEGVSCLFGLTTTSPGEEYYLTNKIVYPLSSNPVIRLRGESFVVRANASSNAFGWTPSLSGFDEAPLKLNSAVYNESTGLWALDVTVPTEASDYLYSLTLNFKEGKTERAYTEPRAVQVLTSYPSKFRFVHFTDPHVKHQFEEQLRRIVREINLIHPSFVLISGDLIHFATEDTYAYFYEILQGFDVPTFVCPGNHDIPRDGGKLYRRYFGGLYYSADFGPYHIISLYSGNGDTASFDDEQLRWLEKDLFGHADRDMTIVQLHHPIEPLGTDGCDRVLELINQYDVSSVFSGHLHTNVIINRNGHWFITTAAARDGYRIVNIEGKIMLSHTFIPPNRLGCGYHPSNDGSYSVVLAMIQNDHEQNFQNLLLKFIVPKTVDLCEYKVFNGLESQVINGKNVYVFYVEANVSARNYSILGVTTSIDSTPPQVSSILINPGLNTDYSLVVEATVKDDWWGVERVWFLYSTNEDSWVDPHCVMEQAIDDMTKYTATITLPSIFNETVTYFVMARDLAGNYEHTIPIKHQIGF